MRTNTIDEVGMERRMNFWYEGMGNDYYLGYRRRVDAEENYGRINVSTPQPKKTKPIVLKASVQLKKLRRLKDAGQNIDTRLDALIEKYEGIRDSYSDKENERVQECLAYANALKTEKEK